MKKRHWGILHLELSFHNIVAFKKLIIFFFFFSSWAQKNVTNQQLIWYSYHNTLLINEKWTLKSEIQERHFVKPFKQLNWGFRTNVERKIAEDLKLSVGMTFFLQNSPIPNSDNDLIVPELRPDIGFNTKREFKWMSILHRYKLEARFFRQVENNELVGGYEFSNFRLRYQLGLDVPLVKKEDHNRIILVLKDELMVNFGNKIINNRFDQNRIYLGVNYVVNPKLAIEMGYMNWLQQQTSGVDFLNRNILRLSLFHSLSLNNKKT